MTNGGIRVFKNVIRMMDDPKFIRFSVNSEGTSMAVTPYHKRSFTSFRVPKNLYSDNGAMIVYSKAFCELLYKKLGWDEDYLYRVPGKILYDRKIAVFDLSKAFCYINE